MLGGMRIKQLTRSVALRVSEVKTASGQQLALLLLAAEQSAQCTGDGIGVNLLATQHSLNLIVDRRGQLLFRKASTASTVALACSGEIFACFATFLINSSMRVPPGNLFGQQPVQRSFIESSHAQLLGFGQFAAGGFAHHYVIGLLADAVGDFAAGRFDQRGDFFARP